jgi:adenine-specific DNA-methyltransferase
MTMTAEEILNSNKLRGGYYTPQAMADFVCKWAITKPTQRVLEPSCGDGNFVEAAIKRFIELGVVPRRLQGQLNGIELIKEEAEKAKARAARYGLNSTTIIKSDFFNYISGANGSSHYDVVVGNPPFIRYQNFPEAHREKAFAMMQQMGLKPNKLTNIWVPFLVIAASILNKNGKLGMVIPAELFQVKYAAETRVFLANFFARITIITFKKLVFSDIQQEVVLLLCEKDASSNKGIRVVEISSLDELAGLDIAKIHKAEVKSLDHSSEKWTKYFLEEEEIRLLREIKADARIKTCSDVMDVDVGIVTGRNDFFMMNADEVSLFELKPYTRKVMSKSAHFKGIIFNNVDLEDNSVAQYPVHLFLPPDKEFDKLPKACRNYIEHGEKQGHNSGYKCKIRNRWYITPSLWAPDAFALRQVGDYPKLIVNKTEASSTDTIHRVRFKTKIKPEDLAMSFLNSLTFAFSEITGRSYGGGVLTFEPTEIEELPLPILDNSKIDYKKIDALMRQRKIEEVLDLVDEELLVKQYKFIKSEVRSLRIIWKKLSDRRRNRK